MGRKKIKNKRRGILIHCRDKYGIEFIKDLKSLKYKQFWNLTYMGDKYNLSKERIRQIFKMVYKEPFRKYQVRKTKDLLNEINSMGGTCDPRNKMKDCNTNVGKGTTGEIIVLNKCIEIGLDVSGAKDKSVDLIINGNEVDVKICYKMFKPSKENISEYYRFRLSKLEREKNKFVVCLCALEKKYYIIPIKDIKTKGENIFIPKKDKFLRKNNKYPINKYKLYENAWHLLEKR